MGIEYINREKICSYCGRVIEFFLYLLIFALAFSKALIEISSTIIILSWLTQRAFTHAPVPNHIGFGTVRGSTPRNPETEGAVGVNPRGSTDNCSSFGTRFTLGLKKFNPVSTYLDVPVLMYALAAFLSAVFSTNFSLSLRSFGAKTMEYIMLYFIVAEFTSDTRRIKNIAIIICVSAAMIAADGIFQYLFGFDFLRFRPLEAERITASFKMPGDLAGYLGPLLCLPLSLSFLRLKSKVRYFFRTESIILLGLLIATFSRGGWLGLIAALCFLGLFQNRKIIYVSLLFLPILLLFIVNVMAVPTGFFDRIKSILLIQDIFDVDRLTIWRAAVQMFKDKFVFGQGLSTFMGNFPKYGQDYAYLKQGIIPYAHNCYLQIAAEMGLVGMFSFFALISTFLAYTAKCLLATRRENRFARAVLAAVSAGIVAILVHSAVDTNLYSLQLAVLFWMMLGLNSGLQRNIASTARTNK